MASKDIRPIQELIYEAIGKASMCWKPLPMKSIFDSSAAKRIADRLIAQVKEEIKRNTNDKQANN